MQAAAACCCWYVLGRFSQGATRSMYASDLESAWAYCWYSRRRCSVSCERWYVYFFFFQAEDGIRDYKVTGVQTCALPISRRTGPSSPVRSRRPVEAAKPAWDVPRESQLASERAVSRLLLLRPARVDRPWTGPRSPPGGGTPPGRRAAMRR